MIGRNAAVTVTVTEQQIGHIEQRLPRPAITDPDPLIAAQLI